MGLYAVEQCAVDKLRTHEPNLALAQTCKHPVVLHGLVIDFEERQSLQVFLYLSGTLFDIHLNHLTVTAAADCFYNPLLPPDLSMIRTDVLPDLFNFFSTNMRQKYSFFRIPT